MKLETLQAQLEANYDAMMRTEIGTEDCADAIHSYQYILAEIVKHYGGEDKTPVSEDIELAQTYSDCYKSENGFRPRCVITIAEVKEYFENYNERMTVILENERAADIAAQRDLEEAIASSIAIGAGDRATALRWMFADSCDVDRDLYEYGLGYEWSNIYFKEIRATLAA